MAIPILAAVAAHFDAGYSTVQFVISAYMLGLAIAQPFNGYLCDRYGRRPVMLGGFTLFVVASIGATLVDNLAGLILMRFLQAVGVSVGTVVSRAVVRDTRSARETSSEMSYIAAAMGFAPIIAPVLGGWLGSLWGYSSVFAVTAVMGLSVLILMFRSLPETLIKTDVQPQMSDLMRNYVILMKSRRFLGYSMVFGFVQGSFFAFMAVGAAVFQADLAMDGRQFGMAWGLMAMAYVLYAMVGARVTRVVGTAKVMTVAVTITLLAGWLMLLMAYTTGPTRFGVLATMTLMIASSGGIIPGALAGVVNAHPEMAGTAGGLSGALGMVLGGMFTVLAGFLYHGNFTPIAWLVAISTSLTALSWLLVRRIAHAQDEADY
jgi:DHA1 family bicyclomycin/chloramphenicol resistance-like MFS transporter